MFILDTDASNQGIGAVISQMHDDGLEYVVAYGSRTLHKAECKYSVTHKELLAVVFFLDCDSDVCANSLASVVANTLF